MQFVHTMLYGLLGGFAEFLPISSEAHRFIYGYLTGFSQIAPFVKLMMYFGALVAILVTCWERLVHIRRELRLVSLPKKRRKRMPDMQAVSDFRLVATGMIPMLLGCFLFGKAQQKFSTLPWLCLSMLLTGIFLYAPQFFPEKNRDSREMNRPEALLLGIVSAFSVVPGLSRIALFCYFSRKRGCSRVYSFDLVLLFSIPWLLAMMLVQAIALFSMGGSAFAGGVLGYGVLAALAAFGGAFAGIRLMRFFAVKMDFHGIAHYCWGVAVFCFIYYLMT